MNERLMLLQFGPDGLEVCVTGKLAAIIGVYAHPHGKFLVCEEEVDFGNGTFDVVEVGKDTKEGEFIRKGAFVVTRQVTEVDIELTGELSALLACSRDRNSRRSDRYDPWIVVSSSPCHHTGNEAISLPSDEPDASMAFTAASGDHSGSGKPEGSPPCAATAAL